MIEKLKNIPLDMNGKPSAVWTKINELVDAVNGILDYAQSVLDKAIKQITALEKSELENLEMLVNNVFK